MDPIAIKNMICGTIKNIILNDAKLQKLNPELLKDTINFRYDIISKYMIQILTINLKLLILHIDCLESARDSFY